MYSIKLRKLVNALAHVLTFLLAFTHDSAYDCVCAEFPTRQRSTGVPEYTTLRMHTHVGDLKDFLSAYFNCPATGFILLVLRLASSRDEPA